MQKQEGKQMPGAQILIETLIEQGVTDVFGYPGGQVLNMYDELYKNVWTTSSCGDITSREL